MKKKLLIALLIFVGIISYNIYTVNAADEDFAYGKEYTVEGTDKKYVIEGIEIVVSEPTETIVNEEKTLDMVELARVPLSASDISINPTYKKLNFGQTKESMFIDLNLDYDEEQMKDFVRDSVDSQEEWNDKSVSIELVIKYHWTNLPSEYSRYYNVNVYKNFLYIFAHPELLNDNNDSGQDGEEDEDGPTSVEEATFNGIVNGVQGTVVTGMDQFNVNDTIYQTFNMGSYAFEDSDDEDDDDSYLDDMRRVEGREPGTTGERQLNYIQKLDKDNFTIYETLNYTLLTNKEFTPLSILGYTDDETETGDPELIMFHDFDNIEYLETAFDDLNDDVNDARKDMSNDNPQKVKVDNTAADIPLPLTIASIILIIGGGVLLFKGSKQFVISE